MSPALCSGRSLGLTRTPIDGRILSGLAVDHYGPNSASLVSSVLNLLGTLVTAIGTSTKSFSTLVVGQIILGFGSQTIETAQSKLYTRWFYSSRHLGLVYGLDVAKKPIRGMA